MSCINKDITLSSYYTECGIMLQGSTSTFPECDDKTPADWMANKLLVFTNTVLIQKVNMSKIVSDMKEKIEIKSCANRMRFFKNRFLFWRPYFLYLCVETSCALSFY